MTEYINAWKNYVNFTERTTVRGYWMAFLFHIIASIVISIVLIIIFGPMVQLVHRGHMFDIEFSTGYYLNMLWGLAAFLPMLALQIRRLRDAGKRWTYIFMILIPFVGWILYIIALCKPSIPDDGVPVV